MLKPQKVFLAINPWSCYKDQNLKSPQEITTNKQARYDNMIK